MKNIILFIIFSLIPIWGNFNFGDCSGSGTFEQKIQHYQGNYENAVLVGEIPLGIEGLKISLLSAKDVDIRLYGENDDKIVHWPYGILGKYFLETKFYKEVSVTYSGYNGLNAEKGHEFISLTSATPTVMTMKAFGYQSGYATVNYSWTGKEGCTSQTEGTGTFKQIILDKNTSLVGTIPPNIENLEIKLTSDKDIDIQLYSTDGTPIVAWHPTGLISGSTVQTITYHGMTIEWSGYNGVGGQKGHEYIKVTGLTTEQLIMKVYGYESGVADVTYSWGNADEIPTVDIANKYGEAIQGTDNSYRYYLPASNTIDNNVSTYNRTRGDAAENWWQVKLPSPTLISKFMIQGKSFHSNRLNGAKVYITNSEYNGTLSASNLVATLKGSTNKQKTTFSTPKAGTYLIVKGAGNYSLGLATVEVYGEMPEKPEFLDKNLIVTVDKWQNKTESILAINAVDYQDDTIIYSIDKDVPFNISDEGYITVNNILLVGEYTFNVVIDDGVHKNSTPITITVVESAIVDAAYRTNDNQPALTGHLPNIYNHGDTVSIKINGTSYPVTVNSDGTWSLDDDVISAPLAIGLYDIILTVKGVNIRYKNYFEIYGSRFKSFTHTMTLESIDNMDISVNSHIEIPLLKSESVRGSSLRLYVENGVTKLQNKSYREIKSLLAKYVDDNNNSVFVTLTFNKNILPYSENNLTSFLHDSEMELVITANMFDMKISFGGKNCNSSTDTSVTHYCVPTSVIDEETYSSSSTGNSEQAVYSTAIATYNHLYNSIDGLATMKAWVNQSSYKNMDFTGTYQSINNYIKEEDKMSYLYRNYIETTMPNHHVQMRSMRYKYAAAGMGGGSRGSLLGDSVSLGRASIWEGNINNNLASYGTTHHEMMHAIGRDHGSGMTYGWSTAIQKSINTLYIIGKIPVVHVPKYIFEQKKASNNTLQFTVHKTALATQNSITFEVLSSSELIDNDFTLTQGINDADNQVTFYANKMIITRLFIQLYGSDSREVMSTITTTPSSMTHTLLLEDTGNNKKYHVISYENWVKTSTLLDKSLKVQQAQNICKAWFGKDASLAHKIDMDRINSHFRTSIDNADWLTSKKFLARGNHWKEHNIHDYTNSNHAITTVPYDTIITDNTLGILCVE